MQWSTTKRALVGFGLSSLAVFAALAPQQLPRLMSEIVARTPVAHAEEEQEKAILQAQINLKNTQLKEVQDNVADLQKVLVAACEKVG